MVITSDNESECPGFKAHQGLLWQKITLQQLSLLHIRYGLISVH